MKGSGGQPRRGQITPQPMKNSSRLSSECRQPIHFPNFQTSFDLFGDPPLINDGVAAKKLLWMRATSVWDDVLHHSAFNNPGVVESAESKHTRGSHFTGNELRWFASRKHDQKWRDFTTASVFSFNCFCADDVVDRVKSRGMQKDNTEASHAHRRRVKW